jgi:esterase/lipase superfamily enzyme
MELIRFGEHGRPFIAFPISMGNCRLWEENGLIASLAGPIESGRMQLYCVDSVDAESWYDEAQPPHARVRRHLQYERYILDEVVRGLNEPPVCIGASFGALHSALVCLRHPSRFGGFVAFSGVFDTSRWLDGYHADETYFTNPLAFVPGLHEQRHLQPLRAMSPKVIVTGTEDPNVGESVALADALRGRGIDVRLELWRGWLHDWPYWKEMLQAYV